MHKTIFDTPIVNTLLRGVSVAFMRISGWKVEGSLPPGCEKAVLIAAPHTSNWDFPYSLMVCFILRLNVYWLGKASLFRSVMRPIMMWFGGIAVERSKSNDLVAASAKALVAVQGPVQLMIPPEGTRSMTRHWKTGFYYIALAAKVPIVMAYMDYERKLAGLGPVFHPTGDIEADMVHIKAFYAPFKGKNSDQFHAD
jgi:1-acyl-sn-glycerol-3-phosphate acyltransferase